MNRATLHQHGFDQSVRVPSKSPRQWTVKCSQCNALVINGVPTHEKGCPNAVHECAGCNNLIPMNQRYCSDCQ